jgi:hypothetical protein
MKSGIILRLVVRNGDMSKEEFNELSEEEKKVVIFEAEKVAERKDEGSKFEVFRIGNFYVEVKTSTVHAYKRIIKTVDLRTIPPHTHTYQ